ncbi:hypothetical protein FNV43_RR26636 [Rhamnella rubrinervis]|uniref:non-specific serine/threonine protein kinase n=1 Tax=Rhamnella rubrinervis TaxID=2594499 RepID=A0A8K0DJ52_9ROSA|nr:hypothetical protein FNV43_RR26636 [Rhamnella rubrinervis]
MELLQLYKITISFFIIFLLFHVQSVVSADPRYEACEPRNCGTGPNISYPFYIHGAGVDFCGQPGFKVLCEENKPIYSTTRGPYVVKDISYTNQTFRLVAAELDNAACLAPSHYFIFDDSSLRFLSNHADIQFFYGCNETFKLKLEKSSVPCASNSSYHSFVALVPNGVTMSVGEGCKSTIAVPINLDGDQSIQTITTVDYVELLKTGFTLEWPGDACGTICGESGGRCGYDNGVTVCFCPDGTHPESCKKGKSGRTTLIGKSGRTTLIAVVVASFVAFLVVSIIIWCLWRKYSINNYFIFCWKPTNKARRDVEAFLRNNSPISVRRYSYLGVKKMTNSFSERLGQGGYGSVYKGKLRDGRFVAVKVLNKLKGNGEEFINEVATISRTSHVNVVTLLGFCYQGRKRALIYEFMPNGSLEKFIFEENPESNYHNKLGWEMLFQISLGIARGLEYLHRGCNTRILHFDIKPHNILLDENFSPKISDFGLARVCSRDESIISKLSARGTAGYIAPEVFCRNFRGVSHKSDVYSYGMMVLEMVGGRKNINVGGHTSQIYFPHWIYKRIELNEELGLERIVDEEDQIRVKKMIMVSLWCIQTDPLNRPAMSEVIEMLEGNLDSLKVPPKPFLSSP